MNLNESNEDIYITRSITNPVCIYIYEYYEFQWQTRSITNRKHPSFSQLTARCITSVTSLSASIHLSIFIIQGSGFKIASCKICFMFCDISPTELLSQPHLAMITVCNPLFFLFFFTILFSAYTALAAKGYMRSWTYSSWQRCFRSWTGGSQGSMEYTTFPTQPYLALLLSVLGHMTAHKSIDWQIKGLKLSQFHCAHLLSVFSWDKRGSSLVWKSQLTR